MNKKNAKPIVWFTPIITSEKLMEMYQVLNRSLSGRVAVKLHSGEPGGHHFLQPAFIQPLVESVHGTIVECNTAYGGQRDQTKDHEKVMIDHGFTAIAPVDIMDAEGELALPIPNGKQIQVNYVGSHLDRYDSMLVLSHFKGHIMGGFGGALKNISIGIASSHGKKWIHSTGDPNILWDCEQDLFLDSMADAASSILDRFGEQILFINVMKDLSIDCDCISHPLKPEMGDIGILASTDPVALDQACVDQVYQSPDPGKKALIQRMEERHAIHLLEAATDLGLGSREYELKNLE